jgi:hypothetical protein
MNNRRFKPKSPKAPKPKPKSPKAPKPKPKSPILRRTPLVSNGIKYKDRLKAPSGPEMCIQLPDETGVCEKPECQVFNCKSGRKIEEYTSYIKNLMPCDENYQLLSCESFNNKIYCGCKNIRAVDKKCPDGYEMYRQGSGATSIRRNAMKPMHAIPNYYCRVKLDGPACIEQLPEDSSCINPNCKMFNCRSGSDEIELPKLMQCDENLELRCMKKNDKFYCKCIPIKAWNVELGYEGQCKNGMEVYDSLLLDGNCSFEVFPSSECVPKMYTLCRKNV